MHYLDEINLSISGHISSGSTTTALILAYMLQKKFVYAGGVHKFIASELGYDPKGNNFHEYEDLYGDKWDVLWEKYVVWKLQNHRNLVVNSKIASFFTDSKPWLFEVFITSDIRVRESRANTDERTETIHAREIQLQKRWQSLYQIDYLDEYEIKSNYDLYLDNTNLTIAETVVEIFNTMRNALGLREHLLLSDVQKVEKIAHAKGKNFFYEKLAEKNLLIEHKEVFGEWIKFFAKDLSQCRQEWQDVVYKYANTPT